MENRGYKGWGVKKLDNRPVRVLMKDCPDPKLWAKAYNSYISGYTEEEVAAFLNIMVNEVQDAIQHMRSCLSSRTVISHNNDRHRILVQRAESEKYRRLLSEALATPVGSYLDAGIAPAGVLKEYREAVGMTEKPGGLSVHVAQHNSVSTRGGLVSSEDVLRRVIARVEQTQLEAAVTPETDDGAEADQETSVDKSA